MNINKNLPDLPLAETIFDDLDNKLLIESSIKPNNIYSSVRDSILNNLANTLNNPDNGFFLEDDILNSNNDKNNRDTIDSLISAINRDSNSSNLIDDSSLSSNTANSENKSEKLYYDDKIIKDLAQELKNRNNISFIPILFSLRKISLKRFIFFITLIIRFICPFIFSVDLSLLFSVNLISISEPMIIDMTIEEYEE
jgi:hypothetical protein